MNTRRLRLFYLATLMVSVPAQLYAEKQDSPNILQETSSTPAIEEVQENTPQTHYVSDTTQSTALKPVSSDTCQQKTWYCNVPQEKQSLASHTYEEGNQLFDDALFASAEAKYREALKHWDHPGIHYNLMLTLVSLDKPVEAYQSSLDALRHGEAALPPEDLQQVRVHQNHLRRRVIEITVECSEPGAEVALDGEALMKGPGQKKAYVLSGRHELVATKPGYLPTTHAFTATSDEKAIHIKLGMLSNDEAWVDEQRFAPPTPWRIVGAGAAVGVIGGVFEWRAVANNQTFRRLFREHCPLPNGCTRAQYTSEMRSHERRYRWYRRIGHASLIASGATIAGGLLMVYLNRPYQVENPARNERVKISAQPQLSPQSAGATVTLQF